MTVSLRTRAGPPIRDGIFWFTIGKESRLSFNQRIEAVPGLRQLLGAYKGEQACINQYRNAFRDKAALIVLDDVWHAAASEIAKASKERGIAPKPAAVHALYQDTVLGVDCKPYFDHYYGRMREHYDEQDEKAAKTILRTIANLGALN